MDEINKKEGEWTSLQNMDFSNEFDEYISYLQKKRWEIDDLIK